ncbi:MAG TPA: hypothetical protein VG841_12530 [Caulobacterales bacterium]|nr:hypothetical protein [Caulobacterales bacterium]
MRHDVWSYVIAAFAVSGAALSVLTVVVFAHLRHWAQRARDEEAR